MATIIVRRKPLNKPTNAGEGAVWLVQAELRRLAEINQTLDSKMLNDSTALFNLIHERGKIIELLELP